MGLFYNLMVYKETLAFASEIKKSVKQMPKYARYEIGDEILQMLRDMKYQIYKINATPNDVREHEYDKFLDLYNHLKIILDDALEDKYLTLKGKYSIAQPLKRLKSIGEQITKWKQFNRKYASKKSDKVDESMAIAMEVASNHGVYEKENQGNLPF